MLLVVSRKQADGHYGVLVIAMVFWLIDGGFLWAQRRVFK